MSDLKTVSAAQTIENRAESKGMPLAKYLVQQIIESYHGQATLLAVCPNSEAVTRAALHAGKEVSAPVLFAATLNQVDVDGGYTGWTQQQLVNFVEEKTEQIGLDAPVLTCLDHGGPWLKDQHTIAGYSYEETMDAVKQSLEACIDAGYELLHIDPTVDRQIPPGQPIPIERVVDRTLELIAHAEAYRQEQGKSAISYEVGTEEVHGGLADQRVFETFLEKLDAGLHANGLEEAWPCFVVGKVGTDLHTSCFEPTAAQELTEKVLPYGALIKGHYTDYVENPEDYPFSGMGGANVGPEYTEEEYKALMDLVGLEQKLGTDSGLRGALRDAVVESKRWKKWLGPEEKGKSFDALKDRRQEWLVRTGSRYIWTDPRVAKAREKLYQNLSGSCNAEAFVLWRIKTSILKYYHAFNLVGFSRKMQ